MVKKAKRIPKHESEDRERDFWARSDSAEYIEWSEARPLVLPNLSEFNFEAIRGRRGPTMRFSSSTPTVVRRWIWMRKYGKHAFPKGHPGEIVKWWLGDLVEAVTAITGEKFEDAGALRRWLTVNAKRLGIRKSELDKRKKLEPKEPRKPAKDEED